MSQTQKIVPYAVSALTAAVGLVILIHDILEYQRHPEWGNPIWASLLRFGAFVFVAVTIFYVLKIFCHKREA